MNEDKQFKRGQTVYLSNGEIAQYIATIEDGFIVCPTIYDDFDEPCRGDPIIAFNIFHSAPKSQYEDEIKKLSDKIAELTKQRDDLRLDISSEEKIYSERMKRLTKMKALEKVEKFIDGKITHYVIDKYGYSIISFEDAKSDDSNHKDTKLLTLFGRSNGNIEWRINQYYDGSGQSHVAYPCLSLEEAIAKLTELTEADLVEFEAKKDTWYSLGKAIKARNTHGISIPEKFKVAWKTYNIDLARGRLTELDKQRAKITAEINR